MTGWTSKPPRIVAAVAAAVVAVGVIFSVVGAVTTGISIDDARHVTRFNVYAEQGLYNTEKEIARADGAIPAEAYVYGPVTALLQHAANRATGGDEPGHAERTSRSYTVRHLVVAAIGIVGLVAVAAISWLVLGHWLWGVVAAGALAAIPLWTGYAMFNSKDIPVATGHSMATLALLMVASAAATTRPRHWLALSGVILTAGAVLMVGTRPGMWASLAASTTLLVVVLWWTRELRWRPVAVVGAALATSYLIVWAAYPRVFGHPVRMLVESVSASADYGDFSDNGRGFLLVHTLTDWPLLLLGLAAAGTVAAVRQSVVLLRQRSVAAAGLLLVGSQAFTLPILILIKGSPLYQGLRQVLFTVPAYAVLMAIGLAAVLGVAGHRWARGLAGAVAVLGLVLPVGTQAAMFPFQYAYVNVAAEVAQVPADNDPLATSYRSVAPHLPDSLKVVCPRSTELARRERQAFADCRTDPRRSTLSPYWHRRTEDRPMSTEYYAILRGKDSIRVPAHCRTVHETTRWRNLGPTVINRVVVCR